MAYKPRPMDEIRLNAMINQRVQYAKTYMENEIAGDRSRNLRYNLGEKFGDEIEGHSQVVSMDVHDTVESLMPDLMEIFNSGPVVEFLPTSEEDVELAEQVTDYVNDIVWRIDNSGFLVNHDWLKDTLLEKNGVLKVIWDSTEREKTEEFDNVSTAELAMYLEAEDVDIEESEMTGQRPVPDGAGGQSMQDFYSVKLRRIDRTGKVLVDCLASEEFGIDAADKALDEHTAFCYQRHSQKTRSDWIEEGFDYDIIYSIPSDDDLISDRSRRTARARNADQQSSLTQWSSGVSDPSMQRITVYECYPRMDYDGDGKARRYRVWAGGEEAAKLIPDPESGDIATEVNDHPFVDMTVMRQPHRWAGRALADVMRPIQEIKSTLQRQFLDNCYHINNGRAAVSNKVNLDDWLNNEVAGAIEVDTEAGDVAGHIHQISPMFIGDGILQALEYFDNVGQSRSGVSQQTALDPQALHKTASGANLMLGEMHKRMLYMARTMAETGFIPLFQKMLKVIVESQDYVRTVRLRNKWVPIDPRRWNVEFDVRPAVGLGHGTRTDKVASANVIQGVQSQIVEMQGGIEGPFVGAKEISAGLELLVNNLGVATPESYFMDAEEYQPKPEEPSAEEKQAQAEMQLEVKKAQAEFALKKWEAEREIELKRLELQAKYMLSAEELEAKFGLKSKELDAEIAFEAVEMALGLPEGQGNVPSVVNG